MSLEIIQILALTIVGAELWAYGDDIGRWLLRVFVRCLPEDQRDDYREEVESYIAAAAKNGRRLTALLHGLSSCRLVLTRGFVPRMGLSFKQRFLSIVNLGDRPPEPKIMIVGAAIWAFTVPALTILIPVAVFLAFFFPPYVVFLGFFAIVSSGFVIATAGMLIWFIQCTAWGISRLRVTEIETTDA